MLSTPALSVSLRFRSFERRDAAVVASWIDTPELLRWVAPSMQGPLTPVRVANWVKPGGEAFTLVDADADAPVGYGELNPMRAEHDHCWLGHVVVAATHRGMGTGRRLVRALLTHAFDVLLARRVSLVVFPDNRSAIRCYLKAGFKIMGEEFHRFGGQGRCHRLVRLRICKEQFVARTRNGVSCASDG